MKKSILIICCLCTIVASAQQEKKKIVISPTPDEDIDKNIVKLFINRLGSGLTNSGRYTVLENRKEMSAVSQEERAAYDAGIVGDEQQVEFGHNEAADYTCYVSIINTLGVYDITCKFSHFKSGELIYSFPPETAKNRDELFEAANSIARKIAGGLDFTSGTKRPFVKAPKCYYDEYTEKYVDCNISISDEGVLSYEDAINACSNKGPGWRLPTKDELIRIYYYRAEIEKEGCVKFQNKDYWSLSKRNSYESYVVNFASGKEDVYSKNIKNPCRCIRNE